MLRSPARYLAFVPLAVLACSGPSADEGETNDEASNSESETDTTSETETDTTSETDTDTGTPELPGSCAEPIPPVELADARLVMSEAGVLRDALGRDVIMRGVNTGNRNKTPPFVPFPITDDIPLDQFRADADVYFARMRGWGLDTARLLFSWEALEPERDVWDEQYLDRYEAMVDAAWANGLRVIVDFHQDVWSRQYCGDGFPLWSVADPDAPWHECPNSQWGLAYVTDPDVRGAFDRFWANEDQLQDEFFDMWAKIGERLADHPGIVALEILNEPGWGSTNDIQQWKLDVLTPFHTEAAAFLHELAPDLLVVYDNPGIDGIGVFPMTVHPRPEGDFLIYGPHLYGAAAYSPAQPNPGEYIGAYATFGRESDVHVLLGEFGFQPEEAAGPAWLNDVSAALDQERISATLWEYSFNDPLWNFENFSLLDAQGNPNPVLDAWVRPWLRAVAGSEPSFSWDPEAAQGSASWVADSGITELVIPTHVFGDGPSNIDISGEGACFTLDMERGELRIQADPGATVELTFAR